MGQAEKCPGPEACPHLLGAAQDSPDEEENRRNREAACAAAGAFCSLRSDVPPHLVTLVARVERLAQEWRAHLLRPDELGTVEREGLINWVEAEEAYRRAGLLAERELHAILTAKAEAGL